MTFLVDNKIVNGCATGVNNYGPDWNMLYIYLNKFTAGGAGDYSAFDASELPQVLWAVYRVISAFYGTSCPEDNLIRKMLWLEVVNSRHVLFDIIYEWDGSLPSGHPATTLINNLYNHINFRCVWILLKNPINRFNDCTRVSFQGDDHVYTVASEFIGQFTEEQIASVMPLIGMTYTSEMKGKHKEGSRLMTEVEFLKRSFRYDPILDTFVGPLRLESITEMVLWTKRGHDRSTITVNNVSKAIQELSIHGEEVYNLYASKMIKALYDAHEQYPATLSFDQSREAVFAREVEMW
jgi:hypothetical protein